MDKNDETADSKPISRWLTIALPLGICFLWALTPLLAYCFNWLLSFEKLPDFLAPESPGTLGDTFGMTNTLFSGLALFAVFIAIIYQARELKAQKDMLGLQLEELKLTREDLMLTRQEFRGQKEQLEGQRRALERSNLDQTFFQMLKLRSDILEGLQMAMGAGVTRFFTQQFERFRDSTSNYRKQGGDPKNLLKFYSWYWEGSKREMDHYYGNLESILLLIDTCDYDTWFHYARILTGLLSLDEKNLLFYHAAADNRTHKNNFRLLVAKAGLVDSVDSARLFDPSHATELKQMHGESALNGDNEDVRQYLRQMMDHYRIDLSQR